MTPQIILSLIAGVFISGAAGYLGSLMLSRRMALVAGPLGHLALPGVALALIYGFDMSLGAFPFIILGIVLIWLFEMRTKLPTEALTAVVFAAGVGIAFLFLPIDQAEAALLGEISNVGLWGAVVAVVLCSLVFIAVKKIFSKMILMNISEDLARSEGVDIKKYNFIYLACVAIIVALGVKLVGGLLTAALVAIPAATARNFSKTLSGYGFLACFLGIISAVIGILLFEFTGFSAGPLVIISGTFFFLVSLFFVKKAGA